MIFLIFALVILLYFRTWKYKLLIDDPVSLKLGRAYAPWAEALKVDHKWYDQRRPKMYTITNIATTLGVCLALYMIWGWEVSLMYALLPTNVSTTTWSVGNYYQTTILFILTGYYFLLNYTWGWVVSALFYLLGMWSALNGIPYFLLLLFHPVSFINPYVIPLHILVLLIFLGTKGRKIFKKRTQNMKKEERDFKLFDPRKAFIVVKVFAYYITLFIWPSRLGFFSDFLKNEHSALGINKSFWLSLGVVSLFTYWAYGVNQLGLIWILVFLSVFSQWVFLGQFVAERYTYLASIGFCLIVCTLLEPYPVFFIILMTLYFYRSHLYIPAWKSNYHLFANSQVAFPHSSENYVNWASYLLEEKRPLEALKPLQLAILETPDDKSKLWADLASCFIQLERFPDALRATEQALNTPDEEMRKGLLFQKDKLEEMCKRKRRALRQLSGQYYK